MATSIWPVCEYHFIGNLDADITFDESYYENLLEEFQKNPKLGIAGGMLFEESNGKFMPRYLSEMRYVPGGVQLFRRTCYEQVGGYLPSRWGGEDTIARGHGPDEWVGSQDPFPAFMGFIIRAV